MDRGMGIKDYDNSNFNSKPKRTEEPRKVYQRA